MTDIDIVAKKLAEIESLLEELRTESRPGQIEDDVREERYIKYTLLMTIQAALDVASHIVSSERLGEPAASRDLFAILAKHGWIGDKELIPKLQAMAGFRNLLAHQYADVENQIVREVVEHHLVDLADFVTSIRKKL